MNKEEKELAISELTESLNNSSIFYLADTSSISANDTNRFRRELFNKGIKMQVAKNTLILKAMEKTGKDFGD